MVETAYIYKTNNYLNETEICIDYTLPKIIHNNYRHHFTVKKIFIFKA